MPSSSPSSGAIPSDWKTYHSLAEPGLTFSYPPTWTLSGSDAPRTLNSTVTLTSPSGTVITWIHNVGMIGGACGYSGPPPNPTIVASVTPLASDPHLAAVTFNDASGRLVDGGVVATGTYTAGQPVKTCLTYLLFNDPADSSIQDSFGALQEYSSSDRSKPIATADRSDYAEILASLHVG